MKHAQQSGQNQVAQIDRRKRQANLLGKASKATIKRRCGIMSQYVFIQISHVSVGCLTMERAQQLVSNDGLQIPLPFMVQYESHPGSEVTVELDDDVIRIVPKLPDQTDIKNRK